MNLKQILTIIMRKKFLKGTWGYYRLESLIWPKKVL